MGMPKIPEGTFRPDFDDVIIDLFESIALEEMALSHILNAEGEKSQALVSKFKCREIDINDLCNITKKTNETFTNLIVKEWLLITKFNTIKDYTEKVNQENNDCFSNKNICKEKINKCDELIKDLMCTIKNYDMKDDCY